MTFEQELNKVTILSSNTGTPAIDVFTSSFYGYPITLSDPACQQTDRHDIQLKACNFVDHTDYGAPIFPYVKQDCMDTAPSKDPLLSSLQESYTLTASPGFMNIDGGITTTQATIHWQVPYAGFQLQKPYAAYWFNYGAKFITEFFISINDETQCGAGSFTSMPITAILQPLKYKIGQYQVAYLKLPLADYLIDNSGGTCQLDDCNIMNWDGVACTSTVTGIKKIHFYQYGTDLIFQIYTGVSTDKDVCLSCKDPSGTFTYKSNGFRLTQLDGPTFTVTNTGWNIGTTSITGTYPVLIIDDLVNYFLTPVAGQTDTVTSIEAWTFMLENQITINGVSPVVDQGGGLWQLLVYQMIGLNIKLKFLTQQGHTYYSDCLEIVMACSINSAIGITYPATLIAPWVTGTNEQIFSIDVVTAPIITFDAVTSDNTLCLVTGYTICSDQNDPCTPHPSFVADSSLPVLPATTKTFSLNPGLVTTIIQYSDIYIRVEINGGGFEWYQLNGLQVFTITVQCAPGSAVASHAFNPGFTATQFVDKNLAPGTMFILPVFSSDNPNCLIMTKSTIHVSPAFGLGEPIVYGADEVIIPTDISTDSIYTFNIQYNANGQTSVLTEQFTLNMGCIDSFLVINDDPGFVTTLSINPGNPEKVLYNILEPTSQLAYCQTKTHQFILITTASLVQPTFQWDPVGCQGVSPCLSILITHLDALQTITFKIETTFVATPPLLHLSPRVTINVLACQPNSAIISVNFPSSALTASFMQKKGAVDQFKLPISSSYSCDLNACCQTQDITYKISTVNQNPPQNHPILSQINPLVPVEVLADSFIEIPLTTATTYTFYIAFANTAGAFAVSQQFSVTVNKEKVVQPLVIIDPNVGEYYKQQLIKRYNDSLSFNITEEPKQKQNKTNNTFIPVDPIDFVEEKNTSDKNVSFYVRKIDEHSRVFIEFTKIILPLQLDQITNETISVKIMPSQDTLSQVRELEPEIEDPLNSDYLNFTWNATEQTPSTLVLQLYFKYRLNISFNGNYRDKLNITILEQWRFRGVDTSFLENNTTTLAIRRQLKYDEHKKILQPLADGIQWSMDSFFIIHFTINLMIATALQQLMGTLEFFQILVFMSLAVPQFPANAQFFLTQIMSIICFDLVDPELTTDRVFDFEDDLKNSREERHSLLTENLQDIEIETINSILNVGGLFNVFLIMIAQAILVFALQLFLKIIQLKYSYFKEAGIQQLQRIELEEIQKDERIDNIELEGGETQMKRACNCCEKFYGFINYKANQLKTNLFIGQIILVITESSLILIISGILQINSIKSFQEFKIEDYRDTQQLSAIRQKVFGIICLLLVLYLVYICIKFIIMDSEFLESRSSKQKYGFILSRVKVETYLQKLYNLWFLTRRMMIIVVYLYMNQFVGNIFQLLMIINLSSLIYVGQARALKERSHNCKDFFCQFMLCLLMIVSLIFTDFCEDKIVKYNYGWVYVGLIFFSFLVLVPGIVLNIFCELRKLYLLGKRRCVRLCKKKNEQQNQESEKVSKTNKTAAIQEVHRSQIQIPQSVQVPQTDQDINILKTLQDESLSNPIKNSSNPNISMFIKSFPHQIAKQEPSDADQIKSQENIPYFGIKKSTLNDVFNDIYQPEPEVKKYQEYEKIDANIPISQEASQQITSNKIITIIDQNQQSISFMGQSQINENEDLSISSNDDSDENIDAELSQLLNQYEQNLRDCITNLFKIERLHAMNMIRKYNYETEAYHKEIYFYERVRLSCEQNAVRYFSIKFQKFCELQNQISSYRKFKIGELEEMYLDHIDRTINTLILKQSVIRKDTVQMILREFDAEIIDAPQAYHFMVIQYSEKLIEEQMMIKFTQANYIELQSQNNMNSQIFNIQQNQEISCSYEILRDIIESNSESRIKKMMNYLNSVPQNIQKSELIQIYFLIEKFLRSQKKLVEPLRTDSFDFKLRSLVANKMNKKYQVTQEQEH